MNDFDDDPVNDPRVLSSPTLPRSSRLEVSFRALTAIRFGRQNRIANQRIAGGVLQMCLTCGCMLPHDHGNPDYLTIEDLELSAKADNMSLDEAEAVSNLVKTVDMAKQETEHEHR